MSGLCRSIFAKKKIFLGDTGATFLGYALAVLSVQGGFKSYAVISFAVPVLIFGLPIFDTAFAMLRRMLTRRSPMSPDRGHIHHRLVDMGFSQEAERIYPVRDERCFGSYGGCACRERRNARPAFAYRRVNCDIYRSLFTKNRRAGNKRPMPEETITVTLDKIDKTDKNGNRISRRGGSRWIGR